MICRKLRSSVSKLKFCVPDLESFVSYFEERVSTSKSFATRFRPWTRRPSGGMDLAKWRRLQDDMAFKGHLIGAERRRARVQPARRCQQFGARSCALPPPVLAIRTRSGARTLPLLAIEDPKASEGLLAKTDVVFPIFRPPISTY